MELGSGIYNKFFSQIHAPVLCTNIVDMKSGKPVFKPYTILHKGDYKIAVLGICGTEDLEWLPVSLRENMEYVPMIESAKHWMKRIKRREHPDLVIGLMHTGCAPGDRESAYLLAKEVPGLALCFCGHLHKCQMERTVNSDGDSVALISTNDRGRHIACATVHLQPGRFGKTNVSVSTEIVPMKGYAPSQDYNRLISGFQSRADHYFNIPITSIEATIYSNDALNGPCHWTSMLHRAYRKMAESIGYVDEKAVTATIVSPSERDAVLYKGALTLKDIISIYPYENTLSIIEMTGQEIIDYLEYAYSLLLDYPDNPIYVFDTVSGFIYTVDKRRPYGSRIDILSESNGNPFYSTSSYRVAMNTFRASGGNGHLTKGLGWTQGKIMARTVAVSNQSILTMLMHQFSHQAIDISLLDEWRYI